MNAQLIDFTKNNGLIPAIVQDALTKEVLMLGYMNDQAYERTSTTGIVHFWSRSRNKLWQKGQTSSNKLKVCDIRLDCDADTLLITAMPAGPTCHTGAYSCFKHSCPADCTQFAALYTTIKQRATIASGRSSYTAKLFEQGIEKILAKVEEESAELLQAARCEGRQRLVEESADLLYHWLVLLAHEGIALEDIAEELQRRIK